MLRSAASHSGTFRNRDSLGVLRQPHPRRCRRDRPPIFPLPPPGSILNEESGVDRTVAGRLPRELPYRLEEGVGGRKVRAAQGMVMGNAHRP